MKTKPAKSTRVVKSRKALLALLASAATYICDPDPGQGSHCLACGASYQWAEGLQHKQGCQFVQIQRVLTHERKTT